MYTQAGKHLWTLALRLCMTEMTIALPIAFKHAHKAKLLRGARAATISTLMLVAYCWRMVWSGQVRTVDLLTLIDHRRRFQPACRLSSFRPILCGLLT